MPMITVVQGDVGYQLNFTLSDAQGSVIDITGATLTFKAQLLSDLAVQVSTPMTISNAGQGACTYTVAAGNFDVPGRYDAQIDMTIALETVTFSGIPINVIPRIPVS